MTVIQASGRPEGQVPAVRRGAPHRAPARVPGLGRSSRATLSAALLASTALAGAAPALAQALPTGGAVTAGSASIGTPTGTGLTVTQSSSSAVVNWNTFSVSQGYNVNFVQPNSAAAILNRVTGSTPSTIAGSITANGQVYLVNPNGIAITPTGTVHAAGFVASSLNITDRDFMEGRRTFTGSGASASVSNAGTVTIGRGGYAALIGGAVDNAGSITVPLGKVGLGSGEQVTLDLSGDGFLQVAVPTAAPGTQALVRNSGTISADGGTVQLSAAAARDMARQAINMSGTIEARSVGGRNGAITLGGGGGTVHVSGKMTATSRTGTGGKIAVTGRKVKVEGATLDASGATGGGTVKVGGDWQGSGTLPRAEEVSIDAASGLLADAGSTGHGGTVVVWSDLLTTFEGQISARGGTFSGDGGMAEVSGKARLAYSGFADLSAAHGAFGTLLLDPYNITISTSPDSNQSNFTATGDNSVINATTLLTALSAANVTVFTGSDGTQAGTITLAAPLSWNTATTLTLNAASDIILTDSITATLGGLTLASGGTITSSSPVAVNTFTLASGNWVQNGALPAFSARDFRLTGGSFLRVLGGSGASGDPYQISDIYGLQGMGSSTALSASYMVLANDIDASGTVNWNGGAGFAPLGTTDRSFRGGMNGAGHVITGLTINRPGQGFVGLFGYAEVATITDLGLVNARITGGERTGGLLGYGDGAQVTDSFVRDSVISGGNFVGGLLGDLLGGTITRSDASGSTAGTYFVGGLAGKAYFTTLTEVHSTMAVSGADQIGGLIGDTFSTTLSNAYATGSVNGNGSSLVMGGLIGRQLEGTIENSYATGAISGGHGGAGRGLVGAGFTVTITNSFWDMETTGASTSDGGGTGLTTAQARDATSYTGWDFANVWYQAGDMRPILRSEAGSVDGSGRTVITNLHQLALVNTNLNGQYVLGADIDASATSGTNASGIWSTAGWVLLGSASSPFWGSLDGLGRYRISDLTINRPDANQVGLIAANYGRIAGLNVSGTVAGFNGVGGLAGTSFGYVTESAFSGSVTGNLFVGGAVGTNYGNMDRVSAHAAVNGDSAVGGLVGENFDTVSFSHAAGAVETGEFGYGGGLAGRSFSLITESYSTGAVSGGEVGGLVGLNFGTIEQSYATGAVSASLRGGGLVATNEATISNSWASGHVSGAEYVIRGGLVATNYSTITNSFWDMETTGQSTSAGGGTGLTTAQARDAASYTGWDFTNIWYQAGDMRPILRSEASSVNADGDIVVTNLHQLALVNTNLNGHYILGGDIDASATSGSNASGIWSTAGWLPLGSMSSPFWGSLDGLGRYRISDLTINRPEANEVGLIGVSYGLITGLQVSGTVAGFDSVGGLAGTSFGNVTESTFSGSVTGNVLVGGAVGNNYGSMDRVSADTTVSGTELVGGLVGNNAGFISRSYATGAVVVGETNMAGGLVGRNFLEITESYSSASVSGGYVGGLVGRNYGTIQQSYATGAVSASVWGGGLVETNEGGISNSWASGHVSGAASVTLGGLAARNNGTVTNSFWDMETTGQSTSAGGTGLTTAQMNNPFTFLDAGWDFVSVWGTPKAGGTPMLRATTDAPLYTYYVRLSGNTSTTYGDTIGTSGISVDGIGAGLVSVGWGSAVSATTNAGTYAYGAPNVVALSYSPGAADDTFVDYGTAALTVNRRALTVTADDQSFTYGNSVPSLTYQVTTGNLVNGDSLSGALATLASNTANLGSYAITQGTLTDANNTNYAISVVDGTATITARPITVTATSGQSFIYGDTPSIAYSITSGNLVNGDTLTGALGGITGATPVGTYAVVQDTLTASTNYALTYAGTTAQVTPRPILVTADDQTFAYGNSVPSLTWQVTTGNLVNGDSLTGALVTTASSTANVGAYSITQGSLTDANNTNYAITFANGTATITPRAITVTADDQTFTYGNSVPSLTWQVTTGNLVNGDSLAGSLATMASNTANVGAYAITQGTVTDANNTNYAITYVNSTATITRRALTVTADDQSFTYGNSVPSLTWQVTTGNLVNGDSLAGSLATTASNTAHVGGYGITQGSLTDANNGNYAISFVDGTATITRRAISVTADDQTFAYGNSVPSLTYQVTTGNLVNGDGLAGSLATTASNTANVGAYGITQGTLTDASNGNYAISFVDGTATITRRAITVTGDNQTFAYGNSVPSLTYQVTTGNLVNGDSLTGALVTTASSTANVGGYGITQGSLTDANNTNYAITYIDGAATITRRAITVTADDQTFTYGNSLPTLTYQVTTGNLVNGDSLAGSLATTASNTANVGAYSITQGSLTDANNTNYAITFADGTATITRRAISVTADDQSFTYGNSVPSLTYQVTTGNLVNGDSLAGSLATTASNTAHVGGYGITQGSLTDANNGNYAITYVNGMATITPRAITATATSGQSFTYGDTPTLAWGLTSGDLVNGDMLTGALAGITATTGVGTHPLTQGTLAASSDYALTYVGADAQVTARPVTVTGNTVNFIYGDSRPTLGYSITSGSLVNGDTLSGAVASTASSTSPVGIYGVTQGSLGASANYALSYVDGAATITARPITVAADNQTFIYGNGVPSLTYQVTTGDLANGDSLAGSPVTGASGTSNVGSYAIAQGSLTDANNSNYAITFVNGTVTVTPRALSVTATSGQSFTYGDTPHPSYGITSGTLVNGDTLVGEPGGVTAASHVGTYALTQGTLTASPNYALTYIGADATITPRAITVSAIGTSFTYGDTPTLLYTVGGAGLVNGDTLSGALGGVGSTSNVGTWGITQGTLAASADYALTYAGAVATVTRRPLALTATDVSSIYGETPALAYTIGGRGLVNGDSLSGDLATPATGASAVGSYTILQGTLTASENYDVTFTGANLRVTPRPLTLSADSVRRLFGMANPTFTYGVGGAGLANGDILTGALTTRATASSAPGLYLIEQGSLSAGTNYLVTYLPGILAVYGGMAVAGTMASLTAESPAFATGTTPVPPPPMDQEGALSNPAFNGTLVCVGTACTLIQ